ncbi:MAG: DEAD/DEAH box helicase [Candidatus Aenigmarchaeota archaeon]|nr:DEAD/DEAH box helicase [Candidatus Aenigmarchaeota archaeon]
MDASEIVRKQSGIKEFNPVQKLALEKKLLEGRSMVVSSPTASGKTTIAELAIIGHFLKKKGKSVYIVPLRALASEKYHDFKEKYGTFGLKVGVSTGDLDSASDYLGDKDLIILTSEKLDSIIRHKASWLSEVSLVIADETHLLTDPNRGPTLEIVLTLLKENICPQILALSATISNAGELADWLDAELVESDYRPVPLKKGVFIPGTVMYEDETREVECREPADLIKHVVSKDRQALVFFASRRNAEAFAEKISKDFPLAENDEISKKVLTALSSPTKQCKREADCLKHGVAFHHAGLANAQRHLVEKGFREGKIKVICATTTLAAGLNLPAFLVIIRDFRRYGGDYSQPIPNLEIQQMLGRAGRPKYDKKGVALIIAKGKNEAYELRDRYIFGPIEPVFSKIAMEPVLRAQALSLIATEAANSRSKLLYLFSKTFFGFTFGTSIEFQERIEAALEMLEDFEFIDTGKFRATPLGKRVAELYIDPLSARRLLDCIGRIKPSTGALFYLHAICSCFEMQPHLKVTGKEFSEYDDFIAKHAPDFIVPVPTQWDHSYEFFLQSLKTARMLHDWISEAGEDEILEKYSVTPGEVYVKTSNAVWLLYAAREFSRMKGLSRLAEEFRKIEIRVEKGIRSELLELVRLKGIGRVKARRLYGLGIRNFSDIRNFDRVAVEKAIGKKTLEKILLAVS